MLMLFVITSLVAALVGGLLSGMVELSIYWRRITGLNQMGLDDWDGFLAAWSIWAKTLLLLCPTLVAGTALFKLKIFRSGIVTVILGATLTFGFLIEDVYLHGITGAHLAKYLSYTFSPQTWEWAGGRNQVTEMAIKYLVFALGAALIVVAGMFVAGWKLIKRYPVLGEHKLTAWVGLVFLIVMLGIIPVRALAHQPLMLERLYSAFPANLVLFDPDRVEHASTAAFGVNCDRQFREIMKPVFDAVIHATPVDESVRVKITPPIHVLIIILESLRPDILNPQVMPRLDAWSHRGLRLNHHYACANISHLGGFAILYGLSPLAFDATIRGCIPPQLCATLKHSGYDTTLVSSCNWDNHGMDTLLSAHVFDHAIVHVDSDFPTRDRKSITEVRQLLHDTDRPRLIVVKLQATHFSYAYPPEYARSQTSVNTRTLSERNAVPRGELFNRYQNSAAFIDDLVGELLDKLDLTQTLVAVMGDHGESFWDDGCCSHGSKLSEAQTRTMAFMIGPGIPLRSVEETTTHMDFVPTLFHALLGHTPSQLHFHGQDLLVPNLTLRPALLVQSSYHSWDLVLVRPEARLLLGLPHATPALHVIGFVGSDARLEPQTTHSASDIPLWQQALTKAIEPIIR